MTPERFAKLQHALDRRQPDLTVFLDAVNKAQNLTTIIRTADAVGIQRLHATSAGESLRLQHMIAETDLPLETPRELPAPWRRTATGEPMPDVVAAVRRARAGR